MNRDQRMAAMRCAVCLMLGAIPFVVVGLAAGARVALGVYLICAAIVGAWFLRTERC